MSNASLILDPSANGSGRRRISRPVSLRPEHVAALKRIASEDGHDNVSRVVQDLIEREMRSRFGRDWRDSTEITA